MRKILFIILLILALAVAGTIRCKINPLGVAKVRTLAEENNDFVGEKIIYEVKFGAMRMGKAVFNHLENVPLEGKAARVMTFETDVLRFYDLETIYSDLKTFLPLKVTRKIRGWNINEDIVELYNQKEFVLTITKFKEGKQIEELRFNKISKPIHNAVLLPFYVRRLPGLAAGWNFAANFGNAEFIVKLTGVENIQVPAGAFEAFRFESVPKKFFIWITTDKRRIPIRIQDSGLFGYTLSMKEYAF